MAFQKRRGSRPRQVTFSPFRESTAKDARGLPKPMAGGSAWKMKPGWYLVSSEDKMIPPDAQRGMSKRAGSTVVEVKGNHAVYVPSPEDLLAWPRS